EVLLRLIHALLDRERDLVGLAVPDPDHVTLVADDHEGREREAPAALDDLRDAVDLDDALLQIETAGVHRSVEVGSDTHTARPPSRTPSAKAWTRPWYW